MTEEQLKKGQEITRKIKDLEACYTYWVDTKEGKEVDKIHEYFTGAKNIPHPKGLARIMMEAAVDHLDAEITNLRDQFTDL